ncbi:Retrovirus-related Pol polyprotein from transposon TNT 1-94 [Vitis vinifera]|uniref:Retrovirus-related Pol polyprotein from transposon TNT 1-94 n=1 Tax=Vitis vinifera TaxID=29760 RepID=A0A438ERS1_VITVI|nr:Retrovirus-related Pol polyprotein from transposon TNT 1-94 [Vitis vinifera]
MNTVRILLSLVANYDWELQQYDVKNAFLHGDIEEEIYMEIPLGFGVRGVTTLLVYVDDIIVTENDLKERKALRCQLTKEFEIKDLSKIKIAELQKQVKTWPWTRGCTRGLLEDSFISPIQGRILLTQWSRWWKPGHLGEQESNCGCKVRSDGSMRLYCDDKSAINIAHNPVAT